MKKTLLGLSLVAATVLVGVSNVDAAKDATNGETKVGIGFSKDTVTPGPYMDNLTLVRYPSSYDFGSNNKASNRTAVFNDVNYKKVDDATVKEDKEAQYLGVFDDRSATKDKGWKLTAKLSDMTEDGKAATTDNKLSGFLSMKFATPSKWNITEKNANNSDWIIPNPRSAGATSDFTPEESAKYDFNNIGLTKPVKLDIGGQAAVEIMGAKDQADAVRGGAVTSAHEVQLTVNNGAKDETSYQGKIDWKLSTAYTGE